MAGTYGHDHGRAGNAGRARRDKVETTVVTNVPEGPDVERVLRELAQQGHKLIFATSFGYGDYVHKVAKQFPDVKFERCHRQCHARRQRVDLQRQASTRAARCSARIAGMMTKTNKLAYIGSFPIPEVRMGINAFALAARKVNPDGDA